jgi:hypothetical protein
LDNIARIGFLGGIVFIYILNAVPMFH